MYCSITRSSFKIIDENIELNRGVKDNKGIVKLKSDNFKDSKKRTEERILITISIIPGIKYFSSMYPIHL